MTQLTDHFDSTEFEHGGAPVPSEYQANLYALAQLLEQARAIGGNYPLIVTSGYRPAGDNENVGGASTSQHLTASAADFYPLGADAVTWARAIISAAAAGEIRFGQLEIAPYTDGHIHLSLDNAASVNNAIVLVGTSPNTYAEWDGGDIPPKGSGGFGDAVAETDADESTVNGNPYLTLALIAVVFWFLFRGFAHEQ